MVFLQHFKLLKINNLKCLIFYIKGLNLIVLKLRLRIEKTPYIL